MEVQQQGPGSSSLVVAVIVCASPRSQTCESVNVLCSNGGDFVMVQPHKGKAAAVHRTEVVSPNASTRNRCQLLSNENLDPPCIPNCLHKE